MNKRSLIDAFRTGSPVETIIFNSISEGRKLASQYRSWGYDVDLYSEKEVNSNIWLRCR